MEKLCHIPCQSRLPSLCTKYLSITYPLALLPSQAPTPFVIIINKPCALDRMLASVLGSTNKEPEILKKSNAIPYTMHDRMISIVPKATRSPKANKPKRNTQANIANNITSLIPNLFRKKGMERINNVSDICEIDRIIVE